LTLERIGLAGRVARAMITKKRVPLVAGWNLTYRCNLRCSYCSAWRDKTPEASTDEVLSTVEQLRALGCRFVGFAGGETLLREDVKTVVDACAEAGMKVSIQSNGVLFPEMVDEVARVSEMQFSLDGPPELNDPIRGDGVHDAVLRSLEVCRERDIRAHLVTVLTSRNLDHVDHVLDLCDRYGVGAYFQPADKMYARVKPAKELHEPEIEAYRAAIRHLIEEKRRGRRAVLSSVSGLRHLEAWPDPPPMFCLASLVAVHIEPDGKLFVCDMYKDYMDHTVAVDGDLAEAIDKVKLPDTCERCLSASRVEFNLLGSFHLDAIVGLLRRM